MNCHEFRTIIHEHLDGDLPRLQADEARLHLDECLQCRREAERLERILRAAAELPPEMEPARDLWQGIEAGILRQEDAGAASPGAAWRGWPAALLAAAVVIVLAAAGLMATRLIPRAGGQASAPAPEEVAPAATAGGRGGELGEAGRALLEAKQDLREAFARQRDSLSPETIRKVDENLRLIESAVLEIETSLAKDPGNRQLKRLLVAAQQREVAMLRKVTQTAVLQQRW